MAESKVNLGAGAPEGSAVEADAYAAEKAAEKAYFEDPDTYLSPEATFGLTDLFERVMDEGVPANARAYLESVYARAAGQEPPVFGADYFTEDQLERVRDIIERREAMGFNFVKGFDYPKDYSGERYKVYEGPGKDVRGLGQLMQRLYNTDGLLQTSLGGFVFHDEGDRWRIEDPFDFTGTQVENVGDVTRVLAPSEGPASFYSILRDLAPTIISDEDPDEFGSGPDWTPTFSFTIPKEGPVLPEGPEEYAEGGIVDLAGAPGRGPRTLNPPVSPKQARMKAFRKALFGQSGINPEAYEDDPAINSQLDQILGRKKED